MLVGWLVLASSDKDLLDAAHSCLTLALFCEIVGVKAVKICCALLLPLLVVLSPYTASRFTSGQPLKEPSPKTLSVMKWSEIPLDLFKVGFTQEPLVAIGNLPVLCEDFPISLQSPCMHMCAFVFLHSHIALQQTFLCNDAWNYAWNVLSVQGTNLFCLKSVCPW